MTIIFLDTKYFFDKLPGDIYLRVFPNAEHEMILHGLSSPHVIYSKSPDISKLNYSKLL